jgi:hypothetical protein
LKNGIAIWGIFFLDLSLGPGPRLEFVEYSETLK